MSINSNLPAEVMDLMLDAVCVVDAEGQFKHVNAAFERLFGYAPAEVIGRHALELVHPLDRERTQQTVGVILSGEPQFNFENRWIHKSGRSVHVLWSARWSAQHQVRIAVARDITERKQSEARQAALYAISEANYLSADLEALFGRVRQIMADLLPQLEVVVALVDQRIDRSATPIIRYSADAPLAAQLIDPLAAVSVELDTLGTQVIEGGRLLTLVPGAHPEPLTRANVGEPCAWLGLPLHSQGGVSGALILHATDGALRCANLDVELLQFVGTQLAGAIERKRMEVRLQHTARHDSLTDLPNRALFLDRLRAAQIRARREQQLLALLFVDLDQFKQVNDRFGHAAGDDVLRECARRLCDCVRESDTVGRLGGDEFLLLLNHVQLPEHAFAVAEKIRVALAQPFLLGDQSVAIAASIGVALHPGHEVDEAQLIQRADAAMYRAKYAGGNRIGDGVESAVELAAAHAS
jgi:diguanylate cyclase (GGDEF)-like protein/PAS domain S-box-containing protein